MYEQIKANDPCPCGSGLPYVKCCADSAIKWVKDEEGNICKRMEIDPGIMEQIISAREKELGRPLKDDDFLFPKRDANTFVNNMLKFLTNKMAHKPPSMFYVFLVEGLLLSSQNIPKLPTGDRILILNAIADYARSNNREELLKPYKDKLDEELYETLCNLFRKDTRDEKMIVNAYLKMLVNDAVLDAYGLSDDDPCPCGSGLNFRNCCGKR
jgi:hypothetical protein